MSKKLLFVLGTRPEAIKLAPIILAIRKQKYFKCFVCNTEQQKELSNQTLGFFGIIPNFNLDVMSHNQTLDLVQERIQRRLSELFDKYNFDGVVVQGDTMTVLASTLSAFYRKIPVFHVEAGLRSNNLMEPFPEEGIRQMVSRVASLHFAPTAIAKSNLISEAVEDDKIRVTGNTVIDALFCLDPNEKDKYKKALVNLGVDFSRRIVLITAHRRENHGVRLQKILAAINNLSEKFHDVLFVIPVHPNPNVKSCVYEKLGGRENIILLDPLDYPAIVLLMQSASLILTDSGGIQEEAPTFAVPILVLRHETERLEGVQAGFAKLVGTDTDEIEKEATKVLRFGAEHLVDIQNPYGDGKASGRIVKSLMEYFQAQ